VLLAKHLLNDKMRLYTNKKTMHAALR